MLVSGVANSSAMLIGGRAIAGCGGAGLVNGALSIIASSSPIEKRALFIGLIQSTVGIGTVIGPVIGGALTEHATWRWVFFVVNIAAAVVIPTVCLARIPERPGKSYLTNWGLRQILDRLDLIGWGLFSPPIVMLLLGVFWGGTQAYAWDSATVIGLLCGALAGFCVFCFWQHRRGEDALIPVPILKMRIITSGCITAFFQMGSLFLLSYWLPVWFQGVKNASPVESGVMLLPLALTQIISTAAGGILSTFHSSQRAAWTGGMTFTELTLHLCSHSSKSVHSFRCLWKCHVSSGHWADGDLRRKHKRW